MIPLSVRDKHVHENLMAQGHYQKWPVGGFERKGTKERHDPSVELTVVWPILRGDRIRMLHIHYDT